MASSTTSSPDWRKSSRSADTANCVEVTWRKSTRSGPDATCVEVADAGQVLARDSTNPDGPMLVVSRPGFAALIRAVQAGEFDDLIA